MATLVYVAVLPHDPSFPRTLAAETDSHPVYGEVRADYARIRAELDAARPDVVVMASGDHFNQWFYDNIPAFAVGKGGRSDGPFPWELEVYGVPPYETSGHHDLGRHLLEAGLRRKFDLAASDTYRIDHGFTVPLSFVRPEQDLPVIPVWTNILIPPLPPGERYFELGAVLRESIEEFPGDLRVAMLATGHMTNSVGGPAMLSVVEEPVNAWDLRTWELFTTGRVVELLPDCTWDELYKHGNGTPGFMVHLVAWGAVHGAVPSWSHLVSAPIIPPAAFVSWDESSLTRKVEK